MSAVVELVATLVDGPVVEGAPVRRERLGFFPSVERAEAWLVRYVQTGSARALWFDAFVGELDGAWEPDRVSYDAQGSRMEDWRGEPEAWTGRRPEDCRFAPGDAVLAVGEGRLRSGIVEVRPPEPGRFEGLDKGDDVYLVVFSGGGHEHVPEYRLWPADRDGARVDAGAGR